MRQSKTLATVIINILEGQPDQVRLYVRKPVVWANGPSELRAKLQQLMEVFYDGRTDMANKEQKAPKQTKKKLTIQEKKAKKKEKQLRKAGG